MCVLLLFCSGFLFVVCLFVVVVSNRKLRDNVLILVTVKAVIDERAANKD